MLRRRLGIWAVATALCALPSAAVEEALAPTVTGETGLFTLMTAEGIPDGEWSFSLYYNNWDRVLDLEGIEFTVDEESVDWNRLSASLGYGISDRWEIAFSLPYESIDYDTPLFGDDEADGLGNAHLGTKFRVGDAMAINLFAELPTGDDDVASGDVGFGGALAWSNENWAFNIGAVDRGEYPDDSGIENSLAFIGVGHNTALSDRLYWITELVGSFQMGDDFFDDSVDLTTGGRLKLGDEQDWAFNFALRTDLMQLGDFDELCPIGGLLGLTFLPWRPEEVPPAPTPPPPPPPPPPAPTPPPPAPPPPPPPPPPEERFVCPFDAGARVNNICKARLDEVALRMRQDPNLDAQVLGYTDSTGSADANQRLSEQRAEAVKEYLVQRHGIDASRITTEGRGSADPVASNDTEDGRRQNRRSVIILRVE